MAAGTFFTSLAGVFLRYVESAEGWTIVFYRSLFFIATMLVFIVWRHGRQTPAAFRAIGMPGLGVAVFLGTSFALYIFALLNTTVANAVFTISLSPFFAALFAWLVLREAVRPATLGIMCVALLGVGFMFGDGFDTGTWRGTLIALGACIFYSAGVVSMRGGKSRDMLPAVCLAGVTSALFAGFAAGDLSINHHDLMIAAALGVVQLAFQYLLVTRASRDVPAAEIALVGRLALILAPLWVWLAVDEVPGDLTVIGGAIIFAAVFAHGYMALRRQTVMQET